jgi:hypothetical protein
MLNGGPHSRLRAGQLESIVNSKPAFCRHYLDGYATLVVEKTCRFHNAISRMSGLAGQLDWKGVTQDGAPVNANHTGACWPGLTQRAKGDPVNVQACRCPFWISAWLRRLVRQLLVSLRRSAVGRAGDSFHGRLLSFQTQLLPELYT